MDLTQKYKINKDKIAYKVIDSDTVILNLDNGYHYSLNAVGTAIWEMLDKGKSLDEILDSLRKEYRIEEKRLKQDLINLTKDLEKDKLIEK